MVTAAKTQARVIRVVIGVVLLLWIAYQIFSQGCTQSTGRVAGGGIHCHWGCCDPQDRGSGSDNRPGHLVDRGRCRGIVGWWSMGQAARRIETQRLL